MPDWSPYFRWKYIVNGVGLGAHPGFDTPGAWNIFALHSELLDKPALMSNPDKVPVATNILPACVGAAYQVIPGTNIRAGELADSVSPEEFVAKILSFHKFLPRLYLGEKRWQALIARKVNKFKAQPPQVEKPNSTGRVIAVDFSRR